MPTIRIANDTRLHVRLIGPEGAPTLLMVQGLGMQLTDWRRTLLATLSARYRLVLFDNRDYGRSGACGPAIDPALSEGDYPFLPIAPRDALYSLYDMAADAVGLLDALHVAQAHVLGFSMGGMIAQILAARHPERVRSLVSLMSSGGQAVLPSTIPAARTLAQMIVHVADRARLIRRMVEAQRLWSGPHHEIDAERLARHLELSYRRCYRPAAVFRQALAYASAGERFDLLRQIRSPALVIHGALDPVIPPEFAETARRLIPDARHVLLPDAAHDLHPAVLPRVSAAILDHLACAERARLIHSD